jgi:hypothetical protein
MARLTVQCHQEQYGEDAVGGGGYQEVPADVSTDYIHQAYQQNPRFRPDGKLDNVAVSGKIH